MIWSVRSRRAFQRLRDEGQRSRHGPLWVVVVPDPAAAPPRVAYAVGRAVGPAVIRNRVRRQLRAVMAEQARLGLPAGWYLVGVAPAAADLPATALADHLRQALGRARARTAPGALA